MSFILLCFCFSPSKIPLLNIEFRVLLALLVVASALWSSLMNLHTVSQGGCGRNSSSIAVRPLLLPFLCNQQTSHCLGLSLIQDTSIIFPMWPIGFLIFLAFVASNHSSSHVLEQHPALLLLCYGIAFSKITNQLIVSDIHFFSPRRCALIVTQIAHMSKSALTTWDTAYIAPLLVCINQYFNFLIGEHLILRLLFVSCCLRQNSVSPVRGRSSFEP